MRAGEMRTNAAVILTARVSLACITVLALAALTASSRATELNVTWVDGYDLDNSPAAAAAFPGNEIVVAVTVESALPARWNTLHPSQPGSMAFIFTPVRVRVDEVLRGVPVLVNGEMTIRQLGGRVGNDEFVVADAVPSSDLQTGCRLILFLGEQREIGGILAATPNMAYVVDTQGFATSTDGRWAIELSLFKSLITND